MLLSYWLTLNRTLSCYVSVHHLYNHLTNVDYNLSWQNGGLSLIEHDSPWNPCPSSASFRIERFTTCKFPSGYSYNLSHVTTKPWLNIYNIVSVYPPETSVHSYSTSGLGSSIIRTVLEYIIEIDIPTNNNGGYLKGCETNDRITSISGSNEKR